MTAPGAEPTTVGLRSDDGNAPIPAIRWTAIEPRESTHTGYSWYVNGSPARNPSSAIQVRKPDAALAELISPITPAVLPVDGLPGLWNRAKEHLILSFAITRNG